MTQSGQGDSPSARPAREGIVLPSDGGEPLLPGTTGDRTAPAGGRTWDGGWSPTAAPDQDPGPGRHAQPGQGPAQPGWGAPADGTGSPSEVQGSGQYGQGAQQGSGQYAQPGQGAQQGSGQYGQGGQGAQQGSGQYGQGGQGAQQGSGQPGWGASAEGTGSPSPVWGASEPHRSAPAPDWGTPATAQANWAGPGTGQGWDESAASQGWTDPGAQGWGGTPAPSQPLPPEGTRPGRHGTGGHRAPQAPGAHASAPPPQAPDGRHTPSHRAGAASPLPPAAPVDEGATQYLPPVPAAPDEGATQYLPPVPAAPDEGATQYLPPVPAAPDEGATQFLPPVSPGALPPEVPSDATRYLGRANHAPPGPLPSAGHPDAEATQYIAPVPAEPAGASYGIHPGGPEDRTPPAEFDNLFRSEPEGPSSTQQLPRIDSPSRRAPQGAGPGAPGGRAAARRGADGGSGGGGGGGGSRTGSRVPVIAAVGVGIAVLGIGAGALLSTGSGGDEKNEGKPVSAAASTATQSPSASADPAKAQAVALDKLLADSNGSRASVIKAVGNVRACNNLGQAATDLRAAAGQRNNLVTRLSRLKVDKLPNHADLTTALTNAWKASASADNHYAAWADQVAGKHGCHKHRARTTAQSQAGDRASGTASAQKNKAAGLWNSIASTYGLTQRQATQL